MNCIPIDQKCWIFILGEVDFSNDLVKLVIYSIYNTIYII